MYFSIAVEGKFTVFRPTFIESNMCDNWSVTVSNLNPCLYVANNIYITDHNTGIVYTNCLSLGDSQGGYARFWARYLAHEGDELQECQILQSYRKSGNNAPVDSGSDWRLDSAGSKNAGPKSLPGFWSPADSSGLCQAQQTDQYPGLPLEQPETIVNDIFKTYFQYRPAGGGIWVTLGRVNWSWADDATYTSGRWNIPPGTISPPQYHNDDDFPRWGK
jgi:hypothetical protein